MKIKSPTVTFYTEGFTLLELVVAIAVFAMMAAIAYAGLDNVLTARERTDAQANQLVKLQTAFTYIARDIGQTVNRGIRDEYGEQQDAMIGRDIEGYLIELTRAGWRNPVPMEERPRSSLQRVAYKLEDDKLIRATWTVLDRDPDSQPLETELLDNVTKLEFQFLDNDNDEKWHTSWPQEDLNAPAPAAGAPAKRKGPPRGVKIVLESKIFGTIERLFAISGV